MTVTETTVRKTSGESRMALRSFLPADYASWQTINFPNGSRWYGQSIDGVMSSSVLYDPNTLSITRTDIAPVSDTQVQTLRTIAASLAGSARVWERRIISQLGIGVYQEPRDIFLTVAYAHPDQMEASVLGSAKVFRGLAGFFAAHMDIQHVKITVPGRPGSGIPEHVIDFRGKRITVDGVPYGKASKTPGFRETGSHIGSMMQDLFGESGWESETAANIGTRMISRAVTLLQQPYPHHEEQSQQQ